MQLVHNPVDTKCSWCTMQLVHNLVDAQCSWCTMQLMHNPVGAQCSLCTIQLMHNAAGAQCSWCTMQLVHNAVGAQCSWCSMQLVHNVIPSCKTIPGQRSRGTMSTMMQLQRTFPSFEYWSSSEDKLIWSKYDHNFFTRHKSPFETKDRSIL